jgi:hypothetical protein
VPAGSYPVKNITDMAFSSTVNASAEQNHGDQQNALPYRDV